MATKLITGKRMVTASLTNLFYMLISSIFFLVFTPLTLKFLGIETYGVWTLMLAVLQFAGLANFGSGSAITKYIAEYSVLEEGQNKISAAITFSYLFMIVCGFSASAIVWFLRYVISSQITSITLTRSTIADAIGITSLSLLPLFLSQLSKGILYGLVKNELAGALDLLQNIFLWFGAFLIGLLKGDLLELGILCLSLNLLFFLISTIAAYSAIRKFHVFFLIDRSIIRQFFNYSFFSWISSLGISMFQSLDKVVVGMVISPAAAGVYAIGTSIALRLNMLAGQFTQILTPYASSYQAKDRNQEINSTYRKVAFFVACLMSLCSIFLFVWMDLILKYWMGSSFSESYSLVFKFLVIAYAIISTVRPAHQVLSGLGEVNIPALTFILSGLFSLIMLWILASTDSLIGAAIANMFYGTILFLNFYLYKKLNIKPIKAFFYDIAFPLIITAPIYLFSYDKLQLVYRLAVSLLGLSVILMALYIKFKNQVFGNLKPLHHIFCR